MKTKTILCSLLIAGWNMPVQAQQPVAADAWSSLVPYIESRMNEWHIPGAAVVVIKGDSVLFQQAFGYADVESKQRVNSKTLFAIGSCTKSFTATGLLLLADEKKAVLSEPVTTYYPTLQLSDTVVQKQITLQDILAHRTGFDRSDYIFYGAGYSRAEILNRMKYMKPVAPFRNSFLYNNMMYTLAGTVIEKVSGNNYEDFIAQRIFQPLQMKRTCFTLSAGETNRALPYLFYNNSLQRQSMPVLTGVEPAGAIWSDMNDMTNWLRFLVSGGKADTTRLLSPRAAGLLKTPVAFTGNGMRADETEYKSYGLGFGFTAYKGYRVMYHTGVAGGYMAHVAVLPEEKIGIVFLCNTETFTNAIINNIIDRAMGAAQTDWNSPVLAMVQEQWKADQEEYNAEMKKLTANKETENAAVHAGVYTHEACRPVEIVNTRGKLSLKYNSRLYPLVETGKDVFESYDPAVFGKLQVQFNKPENRDGLLLMLMGEELVFKKRVAVSGKK